MKYRYYCKKTKDYCTSWRFGTEPKDDENFATIMWWDENEENKCCPLYADFDGIEAKNDAAMLYVKIYEELNVWPELYFSGNKGFHIVLPVSIHGDYCEKIAKYIITKKLNAGDTLDRRMYKSREMWRITNTQHEKTGLYKIPVPSNAFFYDDYPLYELATSPRKEKPIELDFFNSKKFSEWVAEAKEEIQKEVKDGLFVPQVSFGDWEAEMPPCIRLSIGERPKNGEWHNTLFDISRYFEVYGVDPDEVIEILLKQDHYREDSDYVEKTIRNTYKSSGRKTFGCRNNEILQSKCVPMLCKYWRRND